MFWDDILREVLEKDKKKNKRNKSEELEKEAKKSEKESYPAGKDFPGVYFNSRENECLRAILNGLSIKEIAKNLGVSARTVDFYLKNAKRKLGCRRRGEMLALLAASDFLKQ